MWHWSVWRVSTCAWCWSCELSFTSGQLPTVWGRIFPRIILFILTWQLQSQHHTTNWHLLTVKTVATISITDKPGDIASPWTLSFTKNINLNVAWRLSVLTPTVALFEWHQLGLFVKVRADLISTCGCTSNRWYETLEKAGLKQCSVVHYEWEVEESFLMMLKSDIQQFLMLGNIGIHIFLPGIKTGEHKLYLRAKNMSSCMENIKLLDPLQPKYTV